MVVSAGLVAAFSLQDSGVAVVGDIPVGLPELGLAGVTLADVQLLLLPAVGVLVVGVQRQHRGGAGVRRADR